MPASENARIDIQDTGNELSPTRHPAPPRPGRHEASFIRAELTDFHAPDDAIAGVTTAESATGIAISVQMESCGR
jgi:hypothetical protein